MFPYGLNNEEFNNNFIWIDNANLHLLESFKEKKHENNNFEKNELNAKIFLNRKRKQDKNSDDKNNNMEKEGDNSKEKKDINRKENIKRGRRKKDEEYDNEPEHGKFKEDNIIQKIKTSVFNYILDKLNKSLKFEINNFYPLSKELNTNLKKDFNEQLLERTIYDIYMNSDLNKRYINIPDSNKTLIKKIYEEQIEKDTINILKKKFKDILNYIREKDLDNFLLNIRKKEIRKGNRLIEPYMKSVKKTRRGLLAPARPVKQSIIRNKNYFPSSFSTLSLTA